MPQRRPTPETIGQWTNEIYRDHLIDSQVRLSDCLQALWDLSNDEAMTLISDHGPALDAASIMGHSILRAAYTVGWLDIESGRSIILASLGRDAGEVC
jgi:uncharacterized protein (DUF2249 family)